MLLPPGLGWPWLIGKQTICQSVPLRHICVVDLLSRGKIPAFVLTSALHFDLEAALFYQLVAIPANLTLLNANSTPASEPETCGARASHERATTHPMPWAC